MGEYTPPSLRVIPAPLNPASEVRRVPELPEKVCLLCGRTFAWRKKWERDWDNVRYCSDRCRRGKAGPDGEALEAAILAMLDARPATATICPSEAARAVRPES